MQVIDSYTACQVTLHIRQDFVLRLTPPSEDEVRACRGEFSLKHGELDDEGDFMSGGGIVAQNGVIKRLHIVTSKNAAQVACMNASTDVCFDVLYRSFQLLFGKSGCDLDAGTEYADYETVTRVQLEEPLYGLYSDTMQKQIAKWKDLASGALVNVIKPGESWRQKCGGVLDVCADTFRKLYEGQANALVVPSAIQFSISIPTNFYKLSHHKVSIAVESVEDFQQNVYFVRSEMPYAAHLAVIEALTGKGAGSTK